MGNRLDRGIAGINSGGVVSADIAKEYLGFGDREFALNNAVGIMYDYDETENLPKEAVESRYVRLCGMLATKVILAGMKGGSFLTVVDEDDEQPFVNVVINIEESTMDEQGKPVQPGTEESPKIPKKPRRAGSSSSK
ncbi:hypothetical protein E4U58_005800 [Claviceps cyperi]|nr:hypothetical protein E4U58_005800 [Claviceps cyperi]